MYFEYSRKYYVKKYLEYKYKMVLKWISDSISDRPTCI